MSPSQAVERKVYSKRRCLLAREQNEGVAVMTVLQYQTLVSTECLLTFASCKQSSDTYNHIRGLI
jgi:hypothetical protein